MNLSDFTERVPTYLWLDPAIEKAFALQQQTLLAMTRVFFMSSAHLLAKSVVSIRTQLQDSLIQFHFHRSISTQIPYEYKYLSKPSLSTS